MKRFWLVVVALPLLGAEMKTIHGTVLDGKDVPVADVWLDHCGAGSCNVQTDALGRFEIRTSAPTIVFRKPLYAPQLVRVADSDVHVVMPAAPLTAPTCAQTCDASVNGSFCFASVKGVRATKPFNDIDYRARNYVAHVGAKKGGIVHGVGPSWTLGLPRDRDVWESVEFSERDYVGRNGRLIVDARGRKSDGTVWRYIGTVGESASYRGIMDASVTSLLDRVLDGFCESSR